jgi:ribose transport system permease protein
MKKDIGIFSLLAVLCIFTAAFNPRFFSVENLTNTANIIGLYGVFSIGLGLVIITGGIDLSVGSMFALTGVLLTMGISDWHWPWPAAVIFALFLPMALGWGHGWLITRMNLQPFIVTLCGLLIYRGLARFIAGDSTTGFSSSIDLKVLRAVTSGSLLGVPMPFVIMIIVAVTMWIVLHRSVYGRYLFAVGRNEQAARFSGINTRRVITSAYVIGGLLTGISGILFAMFTNSVSPSNHGNFFESYGIAAAVLGGCSLRGGEGSIIGIVIGTALLQVLQNLVNLLGIDSSLTFTIMGTVLLLGVLVDQILQKRAAKKMARAPK